MEEKVETPRTRNREWGFYGTCVTNGHADLEAAWDEAMAALTDPNGPYAFAPETARELLDATWGRHLADQVVGEEIGQAIRDLGTKHGWDRDARNFVRKHIDPNLPKDPAPKTKKQEIEAIMKMRGIGLSERLALAYEAGRQSKK
jgi:hypothetical protein